MRRTLVQQPFEVDVPSAEAWAGLAQVTRWPEWAPHIKEVRLSPSGGLGPGSAGAFQLRGGLRSTFVMTAWEPPDRWTWIGPALGMTVAYDHRFEPCGPQRTRLIWSLEATGWPVPLFGRLFAAVYRRNLDRAVPRLQAWFVRGEGAAGSAR